MVVVVKVGDATSTMCWQVSVDLSGYVEKEAGKGLSANDFTDELKAKLDAIAEGANKYEHDPHRLCQRPV